jgi:type IV pilus assembly protein PilM
MARTIGLDVGTNAVRAVEVQLSRNGPVIERVGQVALPHGAVMAGEVVDAAAVAAALRRLWKEVGFSSRRVVVGVANARVVARLAELPDMPDAEIRSSLQYQVQDLIPIPVQEAELDHQVLERVPTAEGTGTTLRLLLVAAHHDMLRSLLAALEGAGLEALRIDLVPFALIRALYDESDLALGEEADDPRHGLPQAIIGVGAGVTNVVIHERGLPRFVRTLPTGGNAVAEALSNELDLELDAAEGLKRSLDAGHLMGPDGDRAVAVVSSALSPVLDEIRGTLDYYVSSPEGGPLGRVVVTGGGARLPELCDRLEASLGVPVDRAAPLKGVGLGRTGFPAEVLRAEADLLTVPLGLALSGEPIARGARRITLLPGEVVERRAQRRQLGMAAAAMAGLAVLLLALFLLRNGRVGDAERSADREEARTRELQEQEGSFTRVERIQADVAARRATAVAALNGDVAWTRVLQDVAAAMPNDVWLTSFDGQSQPGSGARTVTFSAMGFDQTSTARWIRRLEEVPALDDVWVTSSAASGADTGQSLVTISSDATLTDAAGSDRADQLPGGEGR